MVNRDNRALPHERTHEPTHPDSGVTGSNPSPRETIVLRPVSELNIPIQLPDVPSKDFGRVEMETSHDRVHSQISIHTKLATKSSAKAAEEHLTRASELLETLRRDETSVCHFLSATSLISAAHAETSVNPESQTHWQTSLHSLSRLQQIAPDAPMTHQTLVTVAESAFRIAERTHQRERDA